MAKPTPAIEVGIVLMLCAFVLPAYSDGKSLVQGSEHVLNGGKPSFFFKDELREPCALDFTFGVLCSSGTAVGLCHHSRSGMGLCPETHPWQVKANYFILFFGSVQALIRTGGLPECQ